MMHPEIRIGVDFQGKRKALIIPKDINQKKLICMCLILFSVNEEEAENFMLVFKDLDCEVEDSKLLIMDEVIILKRKDIEDYPVAVNDPEEENLNYVHRGDENAIIDESNLREDPVRVEEAPNSLSAGIVIDENTSNNNNNIHEEQNQLVIQHEIDIDILFEQEFKDRKTIAREVKAWATLKNMKLVFITTERENIKSGAKISKLHCSNYKSDDCEFFLEFHTNPDTSIYTLNSYHNIHNHSLEAYNGSFSISLEISDKIAEYERHGADVPTITNIINSTYKTDFQRGTIYYQLQKLKNQKFGKITEDANKLAEMLTEDAEKRAGFHKLDTDENDELTKCCYMSKRMRKVINKFSDVIFIDGTHKTNRFNMHLVDVVVVNNLGRTVTCFFALLNNQTYESFLWALKCLKGQMEQPPRIIISDDEEALGKGIFLL